MSPQSSGPKSRIETLIDRPISGSVETQDIFVTTPDLLKLSESAIKQHNKGSNGTPDINVDKTCVLFRKGTVLRRHRHPSQLHPLYHRRDHSVLTKLSLKRFSERLQSFTSGYRTRYVWMLTDPLG